MSILLKNASVFLKKSFVKTDVKISNGIIEKIAHGLSPDSGDSVFELNNCLIFPGLIDVHVHLREPGFFYKESILTGTKAAARGGITHVLAMPNLSPVPDSVENIKKELEIIERDAVVEVLAFGAITIAQKGEALSMLEDLSKYAVGFSDDGRGVQNQALMREAMQRIKKLGMVLSAHCEDESLLSGGVIHDGAYAKKHNIKGISSASEFMQVKRDLMLAKETGVKYHVCHVSTKESISAIREAKRQGLDVTCETAPHYLVFTQDDLIDDGRFKMNPPLREKADREALLEAVSDGTVDMIATDHAPHSMEEKGKGLYSLNGVVGLETSFAACYTRLVKKNIISLERLLSLMHGAPKERFGVGSEIEEGSVADISVFDGNKKFTIEPKDFLSKGKSTPFEGMEVYGECKMSIYNGRIVWQKN